MDGMRVARGVEEPVEPVLLVHGAFAISLHGSCEFEMEHRPGPSAAGDPSGRVVVRVSCHPFMPVLVNYADLQGFWAGLRGRARASPPMLAA
jgi:hypothetical protein